MGIGKLTRNIWACSHVNRKHYAKGMCMTCYHRAGRTKKAWTCPHTHKVHYALGLCQNCYLARNYQLRKVKSQKSSETDTAKPPMAN